MIPPDVRRRFAGALIAGSALTSPAVAEFDVLVIVNDGLAARLHKRVGGIEVDMFVESEVGITHACLYGRRDHILRMAAEGLSVADVNGAVERAQRQARTALGRPKPPPVGSELFAMLRKPHDLARKVQAGGPPARQRLLIAELVHSSLRSRMRLSGRWDVPLAGLIDETRTFEPSLADAAEALLELPVSCVGRPEVVAFLNLALGRFSELQE